MTTSAVTAGAARARTAPMRPGTSGEALHVEITPGPAAPAGASLGVECMAYCRRPTGWIAAWEDGHQAVRSHTGILLDALWWAHAARFGIGAAITTEAIPTTARGAAEER